MSLPAGTPAPIIGLPPFRSRGALHRHTGFVLAWGCIGLAGSIRPATADVLSLVSQTRRIRATAIVAPVQPPGDTVENTRQAVDYSPFAEVVLASLAGGSSNAPLASAEARQTSSVVGDRVQAEGTASADGVCTDLLDGCGYGDAVSEFAIRFVVREATMVRLSGSVASSRGAPRLRVAISGPGVSLIADGTGGSEDIALDALLTPGEYVLEALVQADSGSSGSFSLDASFDDTLVDVAPATWSTAKRLFR